MRIALAGALLPIIAMSAALAAPALTTADVNFRTGAGTQFQSLGVLRAGTEVDIVSCDEAAGWCEVTVDGNDGFISGN
ncbi:MAG: SH3 domain-containing protein, partial [Pseudomonadota bacterium]